MLDIFTHLVKDTILPLLRKECQKITVINRKYAEPSIKMTRGVRSVLLLLRLYLILLVILLGYKFFTIVGGQS
jgi:hypothetical protein